MEKLSLMLIWMVLMAGMFGAVAAKGYVTSDRTQQNNDHLTLLQEEFRHDVAGKLGEHVYYSYNVIEGRNLSDDEMAEIMEYLRRIDPELTEDVFVKGFGKSNLTGRWHFYAEQYLNGAIIPSVRYVTDLDTSKPNLCLSIGTPLKELDTGWAIAAPALFPAVKELALAHKDELCDYDRNGLNIDYVLIYNTLTDTLEYVFTINETSLISLDAITGQVIKEEYWNGDCIE